MAQLVRTTVSRFALSPRGFGVISLPPGHPEIKTFISIDLAGDGYTAIVKVSLDEARTLRDGLAREIEEREKADV